MIYQNPYQNIRTADIYGARKQAGEDQLASQQKQLALQQKEQEGIVYKGQLATQALVGFKALSPQQKAAQWNAYRQRIESLVPETKGILPSVWDSNDPSYEAELDSAIGGLSKTYFKPEQTKLGADETLLEATYGVAPKEIARGAGKADEGYDKLVDIEDVDPQTGQPIKRTERRRKNDEGFWQSGSKVYPDEYPQGVEKEEYYKAFGITPKSKSAVNSLAAPPSAPMAIPGQAELPPRQFNTPSPTNRAGETNEGFPIDENAMLQQPQIMPSMGNMMLRGAGAVMADEFAPQPRNALVGGMMPQPSQFAELMPAGSAPNRFGSPGVEGIDFAATSGQGPVDARGIPLSAIGSARPRYVPPNVGQERVTARDMTAQEIRDNGRNPEEFSGQILSDGTKKFDPIPLKGFTKTQLDKMQQELENLRANAKTEAQKEDVARKEKLFVLRNLKQYEYALQKLENNPMFDTGPLDQFVTAQTPLGQQIVELGTRIEPLVRKVQRTPGDPAAASETESFDKMLPKLNKYMQNNFDNLNFITQYYLDLYGANAMVNTKAEYDALYSPDQDIVYIDLRDGKRYVKPKGKK